MAACESRCPLASLSFYGSRTACTRSAARLQCSFLVLCAVHVLRPRHGPFELDAHMSMAGRTSHLPECRFLHTALVRVRQAYCDHFAAGPPRPQWSVASCTHWEVCGQAVLRVVGFVVLREGRG